MNHFDIQVPGILARAAHRVAYTFGHHWAMRLPAPDGPVVPYDALYCAAPEDDVGGIEAPTVSVLPSGLFIEHTTATGRLKYRLTYVPAKGGIGEYLRVVGHVFRPNTYPDGTPIHGSGGHPVLRVAGTFNEQGDVFGQVVQIAGTTVHQRHVDALAGFWVDVTGCELDISNVNITKGED